MNWYIKVLKNYAGFTGRARRKEYWMFILFNMIISIVLGVVDGIVGTMGLLGLVYMLAIILPSIAVAIRRMHDTGHSGWWVLVPIANLIFTLIEGEKGENKYGADPKSEVQGTPGQNIPALG